VAVLAVAVLLALALLAIAVSWGPATGSPEEQQVEPAEPPAGDPARPHGRAA
jgi:hypothetical protein